MNFQFAFRHMEVSEALRDFAEKKLENSLSLLADAPNKVHVVFEEEVGNICVKCDVSGGHTDFHVSHTSESGYEAVDRLIEKLDSQLRKNKPDHRRGHGDKGARWEFLQKEDTEVDTEV